FLQRYLLIPNGSLYAKDKLTLVDKRIRELNFLSPVQAADLSMLGSGATLNVYAKSRKSSRADFLIGFLPNANNSGKMQVTADVNLDLKNMFRNGESILLKWQQLQPQSPRLNLGYLQPYIMGSPFGMDLAFDLFKKDSSFLLVNAQIGIPYAVSAQQTAKLFFQWQNTSLLPGGVDTIAIRNQKKLPVNIDASTANIGLQFDWNHTDYRLNPRKGYEWRWTGTVGIKTIRKNNDILSIADPGYDYNNLYDSIRLRNYQLRFKAVGAHYLPVGKRATVKLGLQAGYYGSPEIFRNDLFQIGGYQVLRGFDEESIYATRYAVLTAEWRLLIDQNSYVMFFSDGGLSVNRFQEVNIQNQFISGGLGILYETKAGLLNLSFALGKRNDVPFNLRSAAKLHFGYINYF
ncbi:MAG TPA: BamA/TamA family outer membrane protein, partial [Ferruginibacter sp.]|nr:BamA/TamA family outer membrane protein [Ferruginibacter sp.]